jgi:hypothetical protein
MEQQQRKKQFIDKIIAEITIFPWLIRNSMPTMEKVPWVSMAYSDFRD